MTTKNGHFRRGASVVYWNHGKVRVWDHRSGVFWDLGVMEDIGEARKWCKAHGIAFSEARHGV